ncbi:MAG TPA: PAS domain S-box protein, partial [Acidimicrobiales bacterium]|nr:PAS domain S-box protein [Acidimicrobiales bacterium]
PAGHRLYRETDVERVGAVLRLVAEGLTLPAAVARVSSVGNGALPSGEGEALLFGQILQVMNQGVWVSRDGRTRFANRKMAELMGCTVEDLVTRPVLDFHRAEELSTDKRRGQKVRAGERLSFTQQLRRADGSVFLAQVTTTPLFNQAGQYEGAVALVDDATARAAAETGSRFRSALLDAIGEAVLAARPDGTIVYANPAVERLLGWSVSELIGENGVELLAPPDAITLAMSFHSRLLAKKRQSGELSLTRRDGTQVVAHVAGAPVLDVNRELVGLIAVLTDSSDRNRIEQQVRLHDQQAELVALLGARALQSGPGDQRSVLREAVGVVQRVLQADHGLLVEIGGGGGLVRVSLPPRDEPEDPGAIPVGSRSLTGYTALAGKVVIVEDATRDRRLDLAPRHTQLGLRSAIAAPVFGPSGVRAVVIAVSTQPHNFNQSSGHFMQSIANVIGTVLQRY